ncbi:MAG: hypothetical protein GEV05_20655, partial [Betaproteobacteria bacterium]|nr:hypothetical protein [Betaproteobacteria bacterium]
LPTLGHPHAVALRFVRRDQLTVGLAPTRVRPCWAHVNIPRHRAGGFSLDSLDRRSLVDVKAAMRRVHP